MSKEELFSQIETVLPYLHEFRKYSVVKMPLAHKVYIQSIYKDIAPHVTTNLACDACVIGYLNTILSYYEREYPLYLKEAEIINSTIEEKSIIKEVSKAKNGRRK